MTWTVVTTYTRPNTGVEWYSHADSSTGSPLSDTDSSYIKSNYVDNGKKVAASTEGSLTTEITKTFVFRDKAAYDEYKADSKIAAFINAQDTYNSANNINRTSRTSSET